MVFDQLAFSDQLTCQTVCKAWSRAAVACINKPSGIYGTSGVHLLASKLIESTPDNMMDYSSVTVKKIKILDANNDNTNSTKLEDDKFVQLLQACPNLEEIVFGAKNALDYLACMDKNSALVPLKYLAFIGIDNNTTRVNETAAKHYISVTSRYLGTIQRVDAYFVDTAEENALTAFHFTINNYMNIVNEKNRRISNYLSQFPLLTQVSILNTGSFFLQNILDTCPAMERLELKERYRSKYGQQMSYNYLVIYERSSEEAPTNPRPKKVHQSLRTIKIGLENLDNDMRDYIHYHLPSLQTIEITDPGVRLKVGPIHKTMEHQEDETRRSCPSATCIIWDGITINSKCAFDRRFSIWFSELKKVEFKNCDFDGLWKKGHGNIKIDLEHLYLDELSLGITFTLKKYEPSRRIAIELTVKDQQVVVLIHSPLLAMVPNGSQEAFSEERRL